MTDPTCPPLPAGSIDFNELHAAARQGHDLDKAIAAAATDKMPKDAETVPAPADLAETVKLPEADDGKADATEPAPAAKPAAKK
jgi:hypothetical protein